MLLTVGRMDAREGYKGHDRVIAALPQLLAAGHDIVYVVVGEGDDRARLQNLADERGVAERVRFVGVLGQDVLVDAYRMADLFVMPSSGEGFGIAFLEAMACGTPALGLAAGGAVDALADGEFGTMASEAEFAPVLARLLADPQARSACAGRRGAVPLRPCGIRRPGFEHPRAYLASERRAERAGSYAGGLMRRRP